MKMFFGQSSKTNRTMSEREIERNALLSDLEKTKRALEIAYAGFDNVIEPDLIDCYIYEVNSVLKRYKFLMEQDEENFFLTSEIEGIIKSGSEIFIETKNSTYTLEIIEEEEK